MKIYNKNTISLIVLISFCFLCGCGEGGGTSGSSGSSYINPSILNTEDNSTLNSINNNISIINPNNNSNNDDNYNNIDNNSNNNNNNNNSNHNNYNDRNDNNYNDRNDNNNNNISDDIITVSDQGVKKPWLFVIYIAGDNDNILYDQLANLDSLETVGSDENTHVVVYIDIGNRSDKYSWNFYDWASTINWDGARGYYIKKDTEENKINSPIIAKYGTVDSGSKEFLATCLKDAMSRYPADNVCLILNDHGAGYYGVLLDDTVGSMMTNQDVKQAIQEAEDETGMRVNILGFDACVMAQIEPAYEYKDVTDYIIGSEELTSSLGWHYDEILSSSNEAIVPNDESEELNIPEESKTFKANSKFGLLPRVTKIIQNKYKKVSKSATYQKVVSGVTPKQLTEIIFNIHLDEPENLCTFSVIDTSEIEDLVKSVDLFANSVINTDSENRIEVNSCIKLNADGTDALEYGWEYEFFDLYNMMDSVSANENITDTSIIDSANSVKEAVKKAVIYNTNIASYDSYYAKSYGLSIFFTNSPSLMYATDKEIYSTMAFTKETKWFEMMKILEK